MSIFYEIEFAKYILPYLPMGIVMVIGEIGALLTFYALIYPRHKDSL